jgi:protocatechuate 3,4-dioxygenase beta subunit
MVMVRHERFGALLYAPASPQAGMLAAAGLARLAGPESFEIAAGDNRLVLEAQTGRMIVGRVSDPDGGAIVGARCTTIGMLGSSGEAYTDPEGRFEVPAGVQGPAVFVDAPGFVQRDLVEGGGSVPEPDATGRYRVDVVMDPACTVVGRVLDAGGRPLAGAEVSIRADGQMAFLAAFTRENRSITNAAGRYVLDGARPGKKVRVRAALDGRVAAQTAEFEVTGPAVVTAPDLVLRSGSLVVVTVREPGGGPAAGARVEADVEREDGMDDEIDWFAGRSGFARVVADAEGRASVTGVPAGRLTLTASRADLCASRHILKTAEAEDGDARREVEIRLRRSVPVKGRVLDPEGKPVAGARVESAPTDGEPPAEGPVPWYLPAVSASTKEDGTFTLDGLPDGEVRLRVSAEGFRPLGVPVAGRREQVEVALQRVDLDVQRRIADLDLKIMEAAQRYQAAKDDAERRSALEELQRLSREKSTLAGEQD